MRRRTHKGESGQAVMEYTVMLCTVVFVVTLALCLLVRVFQEYGWRVLTLIAWEPNP